MTDPLAVLAWIVGAGLAAWIAIELGLRLVLARPLPRDFYGSIRRGDVRAHQARVGVRVAAGPGWVHLGWIADPEREHYRIEARAGDAWREVGRSRFGSFLFRGPPGRLRVLALARREGAARALGEVEARSEPGPAPPLRTPVVAGPWRTLFRPRHTGAYVNDHAIFRDARGGWRLLGITSHSDGDHRAERWLVHAACADFPPQGGMREEEPVADRGELAWAPDVVREGDCWYLFWSPHRLHRMTSADGVRWRDHHVVLRAPAHRFFRDATLLRVAGGHWLLYATGRGRFFSRVDRYQSFDLESWQYAGAALRTGLGSERNSPFASTESPQVTCHEGRFYLGVTYNNGTWFWHGAGLVLHRWWRRASYEETLVFHADNPYEFGRYRGRRRAPSLVTTLRAHAPRWVHDAQRDAWWITTGGWPWAATLARGEVRVAPLAWRAGDTFDGSRPPRRVRRRRA